MKEYFKSLFSITGEASIGNLCVFIIIVIYGFLLIAGYFMNKPLPITGMEVTYIVGAIYGIKKAGTAVENYYQYKIRTGSATITLTRNSD